MAMKCKVDLEKCYSDNMKLVYCYHKFHHIGALKDHSLSSIKLKLIYHFYIWWSLYKNINAFPPPRFTNSNKLVLSLITHPHPLFYPSKPGISHFFLLQAHKSSFSSRRLRKSSTCPQDSWTHAHTRIWRGFTTTPHGSLTHCAMYVWFWEGKRLEKNLARIINHVVIDGKEGYTVRDICWLA